MWQVFRGISLVFTTSPCVCHYHSGPTQSGMFEWGHQVSLLLWKTQISASSVCMHVCVISQTRAQRGKREWGGKETQPNTQRPKGFLQGQVSQIKIISNPFGVWLYTYRLLQRSLSSGGDVPHSLGEKIPLVHQLRRKQAAASGVPEFH